MSNPDYPLLDVFGDDAAKLLERVRPLIRDGRTSDALVVIAQALHDANMAGYGVSALLGK